MSLLYMLQDRESIERMQQSLAALQDQLDNLDRTAQNVIDQNNAQQRNIDVSTYSQYAVSRYLGTSFTWRRGWSGRAYCYGQHPLTTDC